MSPPPGVCPYVVFFEAVPDANMNKIFLYKLRVRENVSISLFIQYFSPLKRFSLDSSALILYLWILLDYTDIDHLLQSHWEVFKKLFIIYLSAI